MANYLGLSYNSVANGPGIRLVLWMSGCDHNCKGCHNPESHDPKAGEPITNKLINQTIAKELVNHSYLRGVTTSGGDPFYRNNRAHLHETVKSIRGWCGSKRDIWIYTGYLYEDLMKDDLCKDILSMADVLVDGPYVDALKDTLKFRGSSNQRIIDLSKSTPDNVVLWESDF